jgi:hypothetical protein
MTERMVAGWLAAGGGCGGGCRNRPMAAIRLTDGVRISWP